MAHPSEFFEWLFWGATATETFFWSMAFWAFMREPQPERNPPDSDLAVSVIVAARNEAPQLRKNLDLWLRQKGIEFELLVIDHASEDESPAFLREAVARKSDKLRVLRVPQQHPSGAGKKIPLQAGIAAARNPVLVFTDADCSPKSARWLACMAAPFSKPRVDFVLGLSPYQPLVGPLGWLIGAETLHTALLYTTAARIGMPFMGVGRNMAVRRRLFAQCDGYGPHRHLPAGDDDLLVNRLARGRNTEVITAPESQTTSLPPSNWRAWWRQKVRHTSVATQYRPFSLLFIGTVWMSAFLWWIGSLGSFLVADTGYLVASGFAMMVGLKAALYVLLVKQWHVPASGPAQFLGLLFHPVLIQPLLGILSLVKPRFSWR